MSTDNPTNSMPPESRLSRSLKAAFQWTVVQRALIMAIVVGTILIGINHGMCIYAGHWNFKCVWQSVLTFFVPYVVSTVSSVLAMAERCPDASPAE